MVELRGAQFRGGAIRIDHILITQLNTLHTEKLNQDREWLERRLDLFRRYAVTSVVRQRNPDFTWWVYIDLKTEDDILQDIEQALKGLPCKLIATVDRLDEDSISMDLTMGYWNTGVEPPDYVATTRLDSDDMLAQDYCENVYAQMTLEAVGKRPEGYCIEYINGVRYSDRLGVGLSSQSSGSRFRTVVARYSENRMDNCYTQVRDRTIKRVRCSPMWLKVVHDKNCLESATASKRDTRVSAKVLSEAFDVRG